MSTAADFAGRLSLALTERGLPLARVRSRLAEQGLPISVATLSYWSSGRSVPARASSLPVVTALEEVLETTPGWLLEALPATTRVHRIDSVMGHDPSVVERVDREGLATSHYWRDQFMHHVVTIDAYRCERSFTTQVLHTAARSGAQYWTVLTEASGSLEARSVDGISHLKRIVDLDDGLTAIQFGLEHPLERGQGALMEVQLDFHNTMESTFTGYGLKRGMDCLVFEVRFDGDVPSRFQHCLREPGSESVKRMATPAVHSPVGVQFVIQEPAPGLHQVQWQWDDQDDV